MPGVAHARGVTLGFERREGDLVAVAGANLQRAFETVRQARFDAYAALISSSASTGSNDLELGA